MNYETKDTEDFSRNLDERTGVLMREVYDEIKLSDMLISSQEHTAESDIESIVEDEDGWTSCFAGERRSGLTRNPSRSAIC